MAASPPRIPATLPAPTWTRTIPVSLAPAAMRTRAVRMTRRTFAPACRGLASAAAGKQTWTTRGRTPATGVPVSATRPRTWAGTSTIITLASRATRTAASAAVTTLASRVTRRSPATGPRRATSPSSATGPGTTTATTTASRASPIIPAATSPAIPATTTRATRAVRSPATTATITCPATAGSRTAPPPATPVITRMITSMRTRGAGTTMTSRTGPTTRTTRTIRTTSTPTASCPGSPAARTPSAACRVRR